MRTTARRTRSITAIGAVSALALLTGCAEQFRGNGAEGSAPAGTEQGAPADGTRLEAIREAGVLTACTTGDYPPFTEKEDSGELTGIDVDMAEHLAETMGVEIGWVETSWGDLLDTFLAECDIAVGGISMNPTRAEQVFFSDPILEDGKTSIARCEDVEKYQSIEDINRPEVTSIFPAGGTNEAFAREHFPDGDLKTHDNLTIFDELAAGNADVMTTDRAEVLYIDHEYDELCAVNPDETYDYSVMGYMLPQGDMVFKQYVDQWLTIALNDGTYDGIAEEWVGDVELNPED
ncbi:transporter substrate-binding domain-containing protein [Micrococcus terreus]|uniref:transporter substrate-binding domain-containing protein n=1 Tax=Micrococcus terreus TaxID=574650 RepID=UPI0021A35518|nr:transporter substrate-binding domain-containing protein [Micrococcus terreus]MCT2089788.1 transporter substrate-binding domain-containing protein [Micrococcus terreus]